MKTVEEKETQTKPQETLICDVNRCTHTARVRLEIFRKKGDDLTIMHEVEQYNGKFPELLCSCHFISLCAIYAHLKGVLSDEVDIF